MGYKHNDVCLQKVDDDEPIFVLRAKDIFAPKLVNDWADKVERAAIDAGIPIPDKVAEARQWAETMHAWQRHHHDMIKIPD